MQGTKSINYITHVHKPKKTLALYLRVYLVLELENNSFVFNA